MTSSARPLVVRVVPVLDFGGVESVIVTWVKTRQQTAYNLRICTLSKAGAAAAAIRETGVPVDNLEMNPSIRNWRATRALTRYLRRVRPDIVHCQITEANWHGAWAGLGARVPVRLLEETGVPDRSSKARLAMGLAFNTATRVIAVSDATAERIQSAEFVRASRTEMIHNPVAPSFLDACARRTHRESSDAFTVLAVGRLMPVKNYDGLIRSFAAVARSRPRARLRIVGEGPARDELEALIASLSLEERVALPGFSSAIEQELLDADLYVQPSHSEGLSVALVEAMATGIPVLASDRGGNPEALAGVGYPAMFSPDAPEAWTEAVIEMIDCAPTVRQERGRSCHEYCRDHFAPGVYDDRIRALYDRLLTG